MERGRVESKGEWKEGEREVQENGRRKKVSEGGMGEGERRGGGEEAGRESEGGEERGGGMGNNEVEGISFYE